MPVATTYLLVCHHVAAKMEIPPKFSTKLQYLHRIHEGISFGDGEEYNPGSYQRYASKFTKEYKN
ncbi:MAG: hypothetical protein ACI8RD_011280, partial [Bacillariaceae sp.]